MPRKDSNYHSIANSSTDKDARWCLIEFTETRWQNTFTAFFYSREKRRTLSYKSEFQRKKADETYQANQNVNVEQRKEWNEC